MVKAGRLINKKDCMLIGILYTYTLFCRSFSCLEDECL